MKRILIGYLLGLFCLSSIYADTTDTATPNTTTLAAVTTTIIKPVKKQAHHKPKKVTKSKTETAKEEFHAVLDQVTPAKKSILEERIKKENQAQDNSLSILLFRPSYILPYYYTASPDYAVYNNQTPNGQKIMRSEFKAQLSILVPIWHSLFENPNWSLNGAYTQLNYWQVYANSQYFREVNYEPEIFVEDHFHRNWLGRFGIDHQSNGRGGSLERSWNRAVTSVQFSGEDWLVSLKVWALIFQNDSSDLHNPDIAKFLGYDNLRFTYRTHNKIELSLELQNIESGLRRGFVQATVSYPVMKHISLYGQYFYGYGQSLIEYNHRTQAAGIGIAFNDWI